MAIQKNIGKNTIGDNNKMSVSLHDYNMSTHDLSTIVRNTQSAGTLVPNLCLVTQKGDTLDIDVDSNVLTHPTTGPLFGSFKLEHHIYAAPVRLYNSWLHNNRTKIGLNMAKVKLPQINVALNKQYDTVTKEEEQWNQVNPSCLLAYLGIRGFANMEGPTSKNISKNALPILAYYDIIQTTITLVKITLISKHIVVVIKKIPNSFNKHRIIAFCAIFRKAFYAPLTNAKMNTLLTSKICPSCRPITTRKRSNSITFFINSTSSPNIIKISIHRSLISDGNRRASIVEV